LDDDSDPGEDLFIEAVGVEGKSDSLLVGRGGEGAFACTAVGACADAVCGPGSVAGPNTDTFVVGGIMMLDLTLNGRLDGKVF